MADLEDDLNKLLEGQLAPVRKVNISYLGPKKLSETPGMFKPLTKRNICYIAMAIVFDETGRVLLIQEAKKSCRGLWYPPAGRVEPGENLIDAVKREVKEEAGVDFESDTLLSLKCSGLNWYRFTFLGRATGGQLKTTAEQDEESLQAQWFPVNEVLDSRISLRCQDFFKALKLGVAYTKTSVQKRHPLYHIGIHPHHQLLHRIVLVKRNQNSSLLVLCDKQNGLPCCYISPGDHSLLDSVLYILRDVFHYTPDDSAAVGDVKGVLTLEHCGIPEREHDGICVTTVIELRPRRHSNTDEIKDQTFTWHTIASSDLLAKIVHKIDNPESLIRLEGRL